MGGVRPSSGGAEARRMRAGHLRYDAEGTARDPEQGVPGTGLRRAGDHQRHAGRTGAAPRRRERAPRSTRRPGRARACTAKGRGRPRRRASDRGRRPHGVSRACERGDTRRTMARADRRAPLAVWAAVAAFAGGFGALSMLRHRSFETGRFDLGNMVQAVWSTAHGHPLRVTTLTGEQALRLGAHIDPVLILFAPLWWLWPSPDLLLVAQAVAIALGALPVYWLARKHLASRRAGVGFALAYLVYPPTTWLALNEFHPGGLAMPALLFAFWYLDEDRLARFGVWYAFARGGRAAGAAIAAVGVTWTAIAVGIVIPHFGAGQSTFSGRYSEARGALHDPPALVRLMFDHAGMHYLLDLVLPLAGLCLLAPIALAALPALLLNLLSATPTQTSIHFHYTAAELPPLIAAAVLGGARLRHRWRLPAATIVLAASLTGNYMLGAIPVWSELPGGETLQARAAVVSEHDRVAARALALIPPHAVVSATNSLGGHLSARGRVLSFPFIRDAAWVAVDESRPGYADRLAPLPTAAQVVWLRRNPAWRLVFEHDAVLVFHRVLPP